ncbi:MAG: YfiR family protein [Bryobacterales bacterium]|nr:YfiR family protein [Bryobacterales bacterium]
MPFRRYITVLALAALLGGADAPSEYDVKAAFLLNFTRFVEWAAAPSPDASLSVCVIGGDPFGQALDQTLAGEVIGNRRITPRRLRSLEGASCDVAYFPHANRDTARSLAAMPPRVLTVGEGEEFLRDGGMIAFVMENRRVRFDINMAAVRQGGVRLSSRLLQVARMVK